MKLKKLLLFVICLLLVSCGETNKIDTAFSTIQSQLCNKIIESDCSFESEVSGVSVTYKSSDTKILENDGKIHQQTTEKTVFLTLTLEYNGEVVEKTILLKIGAKESSWSILPDGDYEVSFDPVE